MSTIKNVFFSLLVFLMFFGTGEVILRITGFKYSNTLLEMQKFTQIYIKDVVDFNNRDGVIRFKKDPTQYWVPVHSFEEKTQLQKPKNVLRIATLGDSCTQGCAEWDRTYPELLQDLLKEKIQGKQVEVLNAAVGSYSSYQGLKRLENVVMKYHPDLVTVYFGWNDHWISLQQDRSVRVMSNLNVAFFNAMEPFRTFQLIHYLIAKVKGKTLDRAEPKQKTFRVPLAGYASNLNSMIDFAQERKIKVLLITAPQNLPSTFSAPFLFPYPFQILLEVHKNYNDIVRKVAAERGVSLLDLDAILQMQTKSHYMSKDGIHFNAEGCRLVAKNLAEKILEEHSLNR